MLSASASRRFISAAAAWRRSVGQLREAGVPEPELSASHLVASAAAAAEDLRWQDVRQRDDRELSREEETRLNGLVLARLCRVPVQYAVGDWDFRSLTVATRPPVFVPRPETEQLVSLALEYITDMKAARVLDVGTGTGAVALALLKEGHRDIRVDAVDTSAAAVALTAENAANVLTEGARARFRVALCKLNADGTFDAGQGDWTGPSGDDGCDKVAYDMVVSNPPYIPRRDLSRLPPEVSLYEDPRALDGGSDGLDCVRALLRYCSSRNSDSGSGGLRPGGVLLLELDPRHRHLLPRLLRHSDQHTFEGLRFSKDYSGKTRFAMLVKSS